jgi:glycosyltransferase involved in cell wall biosynthesis
MVALRLLPAPPGERCYDLVVNSAFAPYKRAHLAATVPRVASIGYRPDSEYHAAAPPLGTCLNQRVACYVYLSPAEVASSLASAAVGGVFSQEEGPCWAATEYLLCGLPVVTTPCRGGREVWLTQRNSITVEPTQVGSVADGVQGLAAVCLRTLCTQQGAGCACWCRRR